MIRELNNLISSIKNHSGWNKIAASGGSILYADTDAHTGVEAVSIYVRENTVIATLTSRTGDNLLTTFNISGATLIAGDLYICPDGIRIESITLTSGSVILYK